jgi:hypothetical protein
LLVEVLVKQNGVGARAGMSIRMTGVRPGSLTTSMAAPGNAESFARAQFSNSATASSMNSCAA